MICVKCGKPYNRPHALNLCPDCNGRRVWEMTERQRTTDEMAQWLATYGNAADRATAQAYLEQRRNERPVTK
jgi:predicted  nucleic acid-binding Zn-ribbon protein